VALRETLRPGIRVAPPAEGTATAA
jgi:hypothetical protein